MGNQYGPVCALDMSEDGTLLAAGFERGAIAVINVIKA